MAPPANAGGTDVMKQAPPTVSARLTVSALNDMRLKGGAMDRIYIGVDLIAQRAREPPAGMPALHRLTNQSRRAYSTLRPAQLPTAAAGTVDSCGCARAGARAPIRSHHCAASDRESRNSRPSRRTETRACKLSARHP